METVKVIDTFRVNEDCRCRQTIKVDGKVIIDLCDGEPEDNTLYRNFSIGFDDLLKAVSGKNIEYKRVFLPDVDLWEDECED